MFTNILTLGILALGILGSVSARADLEVIPQPREVQTNGVPFAPEESRFIVVSDDAADRFAARLVQESVRSTHGVDCSIMLRSQTTTNDHRLWLGSTVKLPEETPTSQEESYQLDAGAGGVSIAAGSDAGLFYGAQTLIQLLEQSRRDKTAIPGVNIKDWPAFGWRARYFDASQYFGSVVTTRAGLEREIKLLARFKLNWLCFDVYNFVPFKSFPACANANTLSLTDWDYLVELAHRYHVTLVPSLQSFAQIYDVIWNCDAGKPYRESTAPGLICPSRPENVRFLQGLYHDLITVFKYSPVVGIGCSEVSMAWDKKYCPLCQARIDKGETVNSIFCHHVRDCAGAVEAAAREAGRPVRPMMWADEFYMGYGGKRWEGIDIIPTNVVMGHWMYWKGYDGIAGLLDRGFDVFFLSATYQHNIYLIDLSPQDPVEGKWEPLLDSGIRNIADQARVAAADTKKGLRGKVLGGGCATFSQHDIRSWDTTWFAYALQSEYSWGQPPALDKVLNHFTDKFAAIFYGARDPETAGAIASAYRDLDAVKSDIERNNYLIRDIIGVYDVQDKSYVGNNLDDSLKLIGKLPEKTLSEIRQRCTHGLTVTAAYRQKLAAIASRVDNARSLQYLISAPHKMENHLQRTLLLLDLAKAFSNSAATPKIRSNLKRRCQELTDDTRVITDEMDDLTHSGGASGYHQALDALANFASRLK